MGTYRIEMPYCDTCSKPDFHTNVTSHAFVACNLQDKKAETALPPTAHTDISGVSSVINGDMTRPKGRSWTVEGLVRRGV